MLNKRCIYSNISKRNGRIGLPRYFSENFKKCDSWISFRPIDELTIDNTWDTISSIYQSNLCGINTETFCLDVTSVKMAMGQGRARTFHNFKEESSLRKGITTVDDQANLWFLHAFVGIAQVDHDPNYRKISCDIRKINRETSWKWHEDSNIKTSDMRYGLPKRKASLRRDLCSLSAKCHSNHKTHDIWT